MHPSIHLCLMLRNQSLPCTSCQFMIRDEPRCLSGKTGFLHFSVSEVWSSLWIYHFYGIVSGLCHSIIITSSPLICFYFLLLFPAWGAALTAGVSNWMQSSIALIRRHRRIKPGFVKEGEERRQIPKLVPAIAWDKSTERKHETLPVREGYLTASLIDHKGLSM